MSDGLFGKFEPPVQAAVLVVSDRVSAGTAGDRSGPEAETVLRSWGARVAFLEAVPDEESAIRERLTAYADDHGVDLVFTSGGTGFAARDVTPEATRSVVERETPGLSELLRREGQAQTRFAVLSRGIAGIRGRTLIVNLPGSPKGVVQGLETLQPLLVHAVQVIRGKPEGHAPHPRPGKPGC